MDGSDIPLGPGGQNPAPAVSFTVLSTVTERDTGKLSGNSKYLNNSSYLYELIYKKKQANKK